MNDVFVTCIKNGRFDQFGRPLVSGSSYTLSWSLARDLWLSGYVSVTNSSVFDASSVDIRRPNLAAELAAIELLSPPVGFGFNFSKLGAPLNVYKNMAGEVRWTYDHSVLIPASCKTAPLSRIIHVSNSGSTGNTGVGAFVGDFSNAKTSVASAITYGNSLGAGYQVIVAPGTYLRNESWTVVATQPLWLRGWYDNLDNRPILTSHDNLSWTLDGTYTNLYKATRSSVSRVVDASVIDTLGNYTELVSVGSLATANTTPNSWYTDGTTVYVRRSDGQAPTVTSTCVYLNVSSLLTGATANDLYVEGLKIYGGWADLSGRPTNSACFVDCEFKYQGGPASQVDAIQVIDYNMAVFVRCVAARAYKDGFNAHKSGANIPQMLTLDCKGFGNGTTSVLSCNGWTTHDGIKAIDVNGQYYNNLGANFIPVDAGTQTWAAGTKSHKSLGDTNTAPTNFYSVASAETWLDSCVGSRSHRDVVAATSAIIHLRNHSTKDAFIATDATGGVIDTY